MAYQLTPFIILYAAIFVLTVSLTVYAVLRYLREDRRLPILAFGTLMFSLSLWELTNFVLEMVTAPELKMITNNVINAIVIPVYLFSLLFFSLAFSDNRRWIKWAALLSAATLAGLSVLLVFDPEFLYESQGLVTRGPVTVLGFTFEEYVLHDRILNPSFRAWALYAYVITLVSAGVLIRYVLAKSDRVRTEQSLLIGVGIGTPLSINGLVFFGLLPPDLNVTDLGFGVTAICFGIAVFRYQLFELPPIGRQQLLGMIDDPLVFVNDTDEVVYSNPPAREVFEVGPGWKGTSATEFFAPQTDRIRSGQADGSAANSIIKLAGENRYFDVNRTTVQTPSGDDRGQLVALREVTERERTNQRLDQFASVVSHDLRTPLNEALVQTDRLTHEGLDAQTGDLRDSLKRMESRIDDILRLARAGAEVEATSKCSLGDLAEEVWESVETDGAELDCRVGDTTVRADPARLFRVLENLFRNTLDHNDAPPTVRIGTFDSSGDPANADRPAGFFVEDDGCGIADEERDAIFEHGYTTNRNGNGYGLSIVRSIVEAHGWEIRVTDGTDGGARFEITGIEPG
jgi:signal transduction histidine kinase